MRGVQTEYFLDASGTMQALKQRTQKLVFFYDTTGRREGFSYYVDDTLEGHYYYLYNIQGDVRAILDSNFEAVVLYDYNSWGQPLSTTGELVETLGVLNPFRYRGYIYDEETGLYYLNSRYYDPVVGRFINADDTAYLGADGTPLSYNLFAYCENDPINGYDPYGTFALNELTGKIKAIMKGIGGRVSGGISGRFEGGKSSGKSTSVSGTSYNASSLKPTQPYTDKKVVNGLVEHITVNGPNSVDPILVRVHEGIAYIVDGHHRYNAFLQLGYSRVSNKYLHSSNLGKMLADGTFIRVLEDILAGAGLCK